MIAVGFLHSDIFALLFQGCQLSDFSLRFQTFCYIADFSTTFYICLKPRFFYTSHHKTISKHSRIQEFWLYSAKMFCDPRQKRESTPIQWLLLCLSRPVVKRTLNTSRNFQTLSKHNVGNPGLFCRAKAYNVYEIAGYKNLCIFDKLFNKTDKLLIFCICCQWRLTEIKCEQRKNALTKNWDYETSEI